MINPFAKIRQSFRDLPDKKKYIEVITASLSIPVLLSVVFVNYLNIQEKRKNESVSPTPVISQATRPTIITVIKNPSPIPSNEPKISTPTIIPKQPSPNECIRKIGPITILTPQEGENISTNPFTIAVDYNQGDYCSVVWRYRINQGPWSEFGDNNIVIYNLSSGPKKIELEVKSIVTDVSKIYTRTFTYQNTQEVPTATNTPSLLSPTPTI